MADDRVKRWQAEQRKQRWANAPEPRFGDAYAGEMMEYRMRLNAWAHDNGARFNKRGVRRAVRIKKGGD